MAPNFLKSIGKSHNKQKQIIKCLDFNKTKKILHVGCGNSELQDKLYEDGYHNIINIDISSVVIEQMNKNRDLKGYN